MKCYPRIRKTVMWGGAALSVLLIAMFVASAWWIGAWAVTGRATVAIGCGQIEFHCAPPGPRTRTGWALTIPLWIPMVAALVVSGIAFRLDLLARHRANLNLCPHCHYNRDTLAPTTLCPECGKLPA